MTKSRGYSARPLLYNQEASFEPGVTMVASRSGPVEMMPISTPSSPEMNFMYSRAAAGNCAASRMPKVVEPHPGSVLYSGVTF